MQAFDFQQPTEMKTAIDLIRIDQKAMYIAGGTNLVDLMKLDVMQPTVLVDINRLPLRAVEQQGSKLRLGALALNSDVAQHPLVLRSYPLLSEALMAGASPQLRNMATLGGNLLQKTRCPYFNDRTTACNKRQPGSGCAALEGFNRGHAILGTSAQCIATHPSDMAVALTALNATIIVQGRTAERRVPIRSFYLEPGGTPQRETVLEPEELIVAIELPEPLPNQKSRYVKIRDRASYAFALVSAAVILVLDGTRIQEARIALGGVGTRPWPAEDAEKVLQNGQLDAALFEKAAQVALEGAKPQKMNGFKIELAQRAIRQALQEASVGPSWG